MANWDEFTSPAAARAAKGNAIRRSLDRREFSKRQVAKVYSRPVPVNSEDAAALMGAVRDGATGEVSQPELKDVYKFKVKLMPEPESPYSADEAIPSVSAIPRSFSPQQSARTIALLPTAWSKKGYVGKIPKIDDLVMVECSYSSFDGAVSLENVEFIEILRSDLTPADLYGGPCNVGAVEQRLNALFTGDWSGEAVAPATAGHDSSTPTTNPAGTTGTPAQTPTLTPCSPGEFCDTRVAAKYHNGPRRRSPTAIVMHATAGSMGSGRAEAGARRNAKEPYGPLTHKRCSRAEINAGSCIAKTSGGRTKYYLKCNGSEICTAKGDPMLLIQTKTSPHYFIDQSGLVCESLSPDLNGNQAGGGWNSISIGIEHCGHPQRHENEMWNDALINASAQLTAGLCVRYGISVRRLTTNDKTQSGLIGHEVISSNRSDPGPGFPWDRYIALVNQFIDDANYATLSPNDVAAGLAAGDDPVEEETAVALADASTEESEGCPDGKTWWEAGSDDESTWEAGCY